MANLAWHTTNTKLAACLGYLQFPIRTEVTQDDRSGKVLTKFFISDLSEKPWMDPEQFQQALKMLELEADTLPTRGLLLKLWGEGKLEAMAPLHALLQGLRAEHNYSLLLDAQNKGRRLRLVGVANGQATEYRDGQEEPEMVNAKNLFRLADLSLVAALGTLGVPVIKIEHNGKHHVYTLPIEGHPLRQPDGTVARYNGLTLAQRQDGNRDLLLEIRAPDHPLVHAYGVRQVHGQLLRHLGKTGRMVLLRPEGASKKAFVSSNVTNRVMDKVRAEFKI